jgi:hypothetical protein
MSDRPKGISEYHWRYYQMGYKAYEDGKPKDESNIIQSRVTRAWFKAGWHDADMEINGSSIETILCTQ